MQNDAEQAARIECQGEFWEKQSFMNRRRTDSTVFFKKDKQDWSHRLPVAGLKILDTHVVWAYIPAV